MLWNMLWNMRWNMLLQPVHQLCARAAISGAIRQEALETMMVKPKDDGRGLVLASSSTSAIYLHSSVALSVQGSLAIHRLDHGVELRCNQGRHHLCTYH